MELEREGPGNTRAGAGRASVREGTKGIPARGGAWGWMTPAVPSASDSLWFCEAELRVSPRHPSGFTSRMNLFRVPQFDSHFYFKLF